jgi:hypothetical protein
MPMTAAHAQSTPDQTHLSYVIRRAIQLGVFEAGIVLLFSLGSRWLEGPIELVFRSLVVAVGIAGVSLLPGIWTRARTIEGIAGSAGIGLAAAFVFLLIDVSVLQPLGTYTNRWLEIGGGSNWWYHPVWWMVGTFLPWMGAFALAKQTAKGGSPAPAGVFGMALILAVVLGVSAVIIGFPGASFGLGTFAVAYLPASALTVIVSGRGGSRA